MDFDESWPMPTERMEVEVVCWRCNGSGIEDYRTDPPRACWGCDRSKARTAPVVPNSLTAARLRLADAAEAWFRAPETDHSREWDAMEEAWESLAALRTKRGEG